MMPLDVSSAPPQTTPRETRLADYQPPEFLVETVDLAFDLDESATRVRSRLAVRRSHWAWTRRLRALTSRARLRSAPRSRQTIRRCG